VDGDSEALKAAFLAELRAHWAAANPGVPPRVFRPSETAPDEILAAWQSTSLFSARDLVLVLNVEELLRSEKRIAALADGVAAGVPGSCLVLVESAAEKPRKKLDPLRAACGARWSADLPAREALLGWGRRRLKREGLEAEDGVLELLADVSENEAVAFFNELEKLVSLGNRADGLITRGDAERLLKPVVGAGLDEYLAAVATGHPAMAARRLGRILAAGEGEGTVLFRLGNLIGGAMGGWAINREFSFTLARRRGPDLVALADAVYRAEAAWKGGRADPVAVLEQITREIAGRN
jgi:DNA polymerase III delta subunit